MPIRAAASALAALLALTLASPTGHAAESEAVRSTHSVATLVTDADGVQPDRPFHAALRLQLQPGWHTYWSNPGDAGIAPTLEVAPQPGLHTGPLQWPLPQRVAEGTLTAYAYTGDVILPFAVTPGGDGATLQAHAEWLVCERLCVPEQADLRLVLPDGPAARSPQAPMIEAAVSAVPHAAPFTAALGRTGVLALSGPVPPGVVAAEFFPTDPGVVEHAAVQPVSPSPDGLTVPLAPPAPDAAAAPAGVIALVDAAGHRTAYAIAPTLIAASAAVPAVLPLLLLAFAGGLLLNLMPCVFPILAMKALSLARMSGGERRRIRAEASSYCLGVIASFVALGAGMVALRAAGHLVDWGFQFQSPVFVTAMAWLLFAIGLNLSGVFGVGSAAMGWGDALARRRGHLGSAVTGILAVVVATPCTAPFMGTAVAGALTLPGTVAVAVFAALGAGLAAPYGVFAAVPRLAAALPRPGAWMRTLQQLLAFPMYGAAVWLLWVVSQQTGPAGVLTAGAGGVAVGAAAWLLGLAAERVGAARAGAYAGAGLAGLALIGLLAAGSGAGEPDGSEPFTVARLDALRAEGRPVFVNMTAAWCLSCLVNDRVALSPPAVGEAFRAAHVAYLKGDWTSKNQAISGFLRQLGQDGVPAYVLYAPGRPPQVLPQVLTEATVLDALAKLKG